MIETMHEYDGAGLAAPRVHVSTQIVIMEVGPNPRRPNAPSIPLTVYINPEITPLTEDMEEDWEGCLSVPGLRGRVPRYTKSVCVPTTARPTASTLPCRGSTPASSSTSATMCKARSISIACAVWSP